MAEEVGEGDYFENPQSHFGAVPPTLSHLPLLARKHKRELKGEHHPGDSIGKLRVRDLASGRLSGWCLASLALQRLDEGGYQPPCPLWDLREPRKRMAMDLELEVEVGE
jgi:hypothetical protein